MKLKFYCLAVLAILCQISFSQSIPNFLILDNYRQISLPGIDQSDTVRITPAEPNNYSLVESLLFQMPQRGQGVAAVKFILHGADGGTATYREIAGGPWTANAGAGATVEFELQMDASYNLPPGINFYGLPFFVTIGKNGQPGTGYYTASAGGGGGSTGMAWLVPGATSLQYLDADSSSHNLTGAIAAGGGGGEIMNANLMVAGNGGGVISANNYNVVKTTSTCSPYSLEVVAGSSIWQLTNQTDLGLNSCEWNTTSASQSVFQITTPGQGDVLSGVTIGQGGGQGCNWTGGPPQTGNLIGTVCEGETIDGPPTEGGSGYTGGGAGSAPLSNNEIDAGGGGTGSQKRGVAGRLTVSGQSYNLGQVTNEIAASGGDNFKWPFYPGTITNGGQTSTSASGYFEYIVIPDTVRPVVQYEHDTFYLGTSGELDITGNNIGGISDNDSIAFVQLTPHHFECSDLGTFGVRVLAVDVAGNSTVAWDTITVLNTQPPYLPGQFHYVPVKNIDIANGPYTVSRSDFPTFFDNCYDTTQLTYTWAPTTFTCQDDNTTQTVNITVTAPNGNSTAYAAQFYVYQSYAPQILYVDASATGANTGLDWLDAYTDLQTALNNRCGGGVSIYMAQGTYYPDRGYGVTSGDRSASFTLRAGDKIYGGFPSGGDVFDNRNPAANPVILSGAIGANPSTTYSYHVVTIPEASPNISIEGVTVSSGYALNNGAGVFITGNRTQNTLAFTNCIFQNNYAPGNGGAIYFNDSASGILQAQNCIFTQNLAAGNGGAVYINGTLLSSGNFTNCALYKNQAEEGAALFFTGNRSIITNCSFNGNHASFIGGALCVSGNIQQVTLYNTIMYEDSATTANTREIYQSPALANVFYSDIQGSGGSSAWNSAVGVDGGHNMDANPQFLLGSNLQISPSSPCRNAGYNGFNNTSSDLNNSPRVIQDTIDIGAYETDAIVYVAWDAPNGGDGISWATAFNKLQDGIDASYIPGYFKDIWIKSGNYNPTSYNGTDQARYNTFTVTYSQRLFGGFAGNETSFNQRNIPANPTILSGDLGVQGDSTDNAYHVVTLNQSINPRFDGLIIQDGNADLASGNFDYGGAVYCVGSTAGVPTPTFVNCVFRNNHSLTDGGAIDCDASPVFDYTISFIQNIFYNNSTNGNGGAIFVNNTGGTGNNVICNLYNCTATGNKAGISGAFAATKCVSNTTDTASVNLYNTIVWGDSTEFGGEYSILTGNGQLNNYNSTVGGANPVFVNSANPAGADGLMMTADDGLRLLSSSPYINGGNNTYLSTGNLNDSLYDITGARRIQQQVVDMGAYEDFGCLGYTSLYVDSSVANDGLGGSWGTAFKSLQSALQVAAVCSEVDTIYLAQGTYYPGPTNSRISQDTTFLIIRKMTVLGGYPSGGGARNVNANPVILDGNINASNSSDNAWHVMSIVDTYAGDTIILDGLNFRNGNATGSGNYSLGGNPFNRTSGAALLISGPVAIIRNCYFSGNFALNGGACVEDYGGKLIVSNSVFSGNRGGYGAAIRIEPGCNLTASANTFYNNSSISDGCVLSMFMGSTNSTTLINNQFINNQANGNGGAGILDGGSSYVYNNTFYHNSASSKGGGLYLMPGSNTSTVSLYNNIFYKDTAYGTGNDIYNSSGSTTITQANNSFSNTNPAFYNAANLIGPDNIWGTSDDGLELQKTSPVINQGNDAAVNYLTDITGAARIQLGAVDPGAFEADSEVTRWYVSVGQDSVTGDGVTWATAFPQFSQGVNAAKGGDSVWVAEGIYAPDSNSSFNMKSSVQIYGGFNATETMLAQRSLSAGHNSILQGTGSNVIINDSVNSSAILDGFVIQNGSAGAGAGMQNSYSSPQVRNCVFSNNSASVAGGGVSCNHSSPLFTNVVFYNNAVTSGNSGGGAIYIANSSSPVIRNCDFVNNASSFNGGALFCLSNAHVSIANSAFTGNTAANLYSDNFFGSGQNVSHSLMQTGNPDSGNIISPDAGMFSTSMAQGPDGLWFTADDGLQLTFQSNLVNKGINDSVVMTTDIEGGTRIQNGTVDIGAYESRAYNYCDSAAYNSTHILYVDGNRPVSGDGYSWQTALLTLGEALNRANYCSSFDTILVAAGTYYPTGYQADTNRNLSFSILRSGYEVLGGYPNGGGTRNLGANNTTLSGDIGVADTNFDNSYHVLVFQNVDNTTGIDGFIITGGDANSPNGDANGNGGGAWIKGSGTGGYCKPRITNCVFIANEAYYGGAIINDAQLGGNSSPTFINCVFGKNICDLGLGGAMYNVASFNGISMPVITNCTFSQNTCSGTGGGIYDDCSLSGTVTTTLKNTILWGNTSNNGLADQQFTGTGCTSTASYCIIQGGLSGSLTDGGHNLSVNPGFIDSAYIAGVDNRFMTTDDGLNIHAGSPAIGTGNSLGAPATDITGALRSLPGIGAYENSCSGTQFDTLSLIACDSALSPSYRYWWTTAGEHRDTISTLSGCDTVFLVTLTLGHSTNDSISATTCGSYISPDGLHIWDTSGVYSDTLIGFAGCDSIITIRLTIHNVTNSSISPSACGSYTSPSGHQTWTSSGVYTDTLQNVAGCDSVITINLFVTNLNDSATATGAVCTAVQTGAVYQWIDCSNGQAVVGATSHSFTATQNGNYKCAVSLSNCTDTTNCVVAVATGISDITDYHFQLYPNPNNGKFIIGSNYNGELQIQIVSTLGDVVAEFTLAKPNAQFDVSELASGVYQVLIRDEKQLIETLRFMKQ